MKKNLLNLAKKYHKWPALIISIFLIMFALSGIIMNHRELFSGSDVNRKWLPAAYGLNNWNLASVRSEELLSDGSRLIYGNTGIWKTDSLHSYFSDFNQGLGKGMDRRKVRVVRQTPGGALLAGTLFGLYQYSVAEAAWKTLPLPPASERIQDILCHNGKIIVVSRSELIIYSDGTGISDPEYKRLPAPAGYDGKMSLFRFAWITHSGEIAGIAGRLFLDLLALLIIFLVTTGFIFFIIPKLPGKIKAKIKGLPDLRRKDLGFHNKTGAWFIIFLVCVPFTGMFLRPPFLITIANARIPVLPLEATGKNNPWEDKLRAMAWSSGSSQFILAASDGFYMVDSTFSGEPVGLGIHPPVSVMGINVFEAAGNGFFYTGSFDGLFLWNPLTGETVPVFSEPAREGGRSHRRSAELLVSGMIKTGSKPVVFDYDRGAICPEGTSFPAMPGQVAGSPMALWNVAQEIHTGRIYQPFTGPFYILIVPIIALLTILVLVTGYIRWRKIYRKQAKNIGTA